MWGADKCRGRAHGVCRVGQGQTPGVPLGHSKPRNNDLQPTPHALKEADPAPKLCKTPDCCSGPRIPAERFSLYGLPSWFSLCGPPLPHPLQVCAGDLAQVCTSGLMQGCLVIA